MKIKISKKLSLGISSVIVFVSIISIFINIFFIDRYYIYEKRKVLNKVGDEISSISLDNLLNNIDMIEENNSVIIAYSELNGNLNNINEEIKSSFDKKKIKLNKFWITEDILKTLENRSVNKIYDQGIAKYKVLTKFIKIDNYIFAIGMPLPYMDETIEIINRFNIYIMAISIILILFLVVRLSKRIVRPLNNLKKLSNDIAALKFRKEEIKTNDEIEELAISINSMSESLENAHNEINTQNQRLKGLISDISHELKTPLALIKVYGQGIDDGLDDGTYMETIQEQVDKMDSLIEKLLFWAKLENKQLSKARFDLGKKVIDITRKYKLIIEENGINLTLNFDKDEEYLVYADEEEMDIVFNNLITNAIKYTSNKEIKVFILNENGKVKFTIANGIEDGSRKDIENIWRPFYVLEQSRSKELSGTGLGLAIVRTILENHKFDFGFNAQNNTIEFFVTFA